MEYLVIDVPDMNDSVSRVVLKNKEYQFRFTYNDTFNYWKFSLYDSTKSPIVESIKIVPLYPLNLFHGLTKIPDGVFGALTKLDRIERDDFRNGKAKFIFFFFFIA